MAHPGLLKLFQHRIAQKAIPSPVGVRDLSEEFAIGLDSHSHTASHPFGVSMICDPSPLLVAPTPGMNMDSDLVTTPLRLVPEVRKLFESPVRPAVGQLHLRIDTEEPVKRNWLSARDLPKPGSQEGNLFQEHFRAAPGRIFSIHFPPVRFDIDPEDYRERCLAPLFRCPRSSSVAQCLEEATLCPGGGVPSRWRRSHSRSWRALWQANRSARIWASCLAFDADSRAFAHCCFDCSSSAMIRS